MARQFYIRLREALLADKTACSATFIDGDLCDCGHSWLCVEDSVLSGSLGEEADAVLLDKTSALSRRNPSKMLVMEFPSGKKARVLLELHSPSSRLVLIGAGHIAQALARLAHGLGMSIHVYDDRPQFVVEALFPPGTTLQLGDFSEVSEKLETLQSDYTVIVTHAHSGDGEALIGLADREMAYLGMIGSKRKIKKLFDNALEAGVAQERLDTVYSPIGLAIGAESVEEIALSIMAEIVAVQRGANPGKAGSCSVVGSKG